MSQEEFFAALDAAAVEDVSFDADFANGIEDGIKRYARLLRKQKPTVGQRSMLEHVAKACRQPDWHFLQSRLKEAVEGAGHNKSEKAALLAVRHAYPFYHCHKMLSWAMPPVGQEAMLSIGRRLVDSLHLPLTSIMDAMAHLMGGRSWAEFSQRTPISNPSPMYRCVTGLHNGRNSTQLEMTPAVDELERTLMDDWAVLEHDNPDPAVRETIRHRTERVLAFRPDFLSGWDNVITMYQLEGDVDRIKWALEMAIANAEEMLPAKLEGKLSFDYDGSRFYLGFLKSLAEIQANLGDLSAAVKTLRRRRAVGASDVEIDMDYALLLTLEGKSSRIGAEITKLQAGFTQRDGRALVLSVCYLLRGEVEAAITWFAAGAAIFPYLLPWLRGEKTYGRSTVCDLEAMGARMNWLRHSRPKEYLFLLRCAADTQIERIADRFNDQYQRVVDVKLGRSIHLAPDESDHWTADLPERVSRLVPRVLRSMGVHSST
ncbi:MAG: hypothetical protein F9K30_23385 [Dechloromonas sp.]|nr:MAG: hypothetical protein F9K30_23385 [Dechloromonas sp.]